MMSINNIKKAKALRGKSSTAQDIIGLATTIAAYFSVSISTFANAMSMSSSAKANYIMDVYEFCHDANLYLEDKSTVPTK